MENITSPGLIITKDIIALTRKTLFENLGSKKAINFLFRFGKELGEQKVKEIINIYKITETRAIIEIVMQFHIDIGHISKLTKIGTILNTNEELEFINPVGIWHDSFEVTEHLKHFGPSSYCVCSIISGFMSGVLSTIFDEEIFVNEMTCRAKGDLECTFEINTKKYWEELIGEIDLYDTNTYITELDYTYDKLIEKTNLLDQMIHFHSSITDVIAQQNDIKILLNTAFSILKLPNAILNLNGQIMFECGLEKEISMKVWSKLIEGIDKTTFIECKKNNFLITPIYLENNIFAYCFFIYPQENKMSKNDLVYLERLSVAASLCFLNEKSSFEATQRFKINFLDRLIHNHFKNNDEIIIHANYIEPKIHPPFINLSIHIENQQSIDVYNTLLNIAKELKKHQLSALLSLKSTNITIFLYDINNKDYISIIQNVLKETLKSMQFKVGFSKEFYKLEDFQIYHQQSKKALNFPTNDQYIYYQNLGIYSELLEHLTPERLYTVAKNELGVLLDDNEKSRTLLYTLYVYLKNNQRLEKTMLDLSLSIGGIKYRLGKIEKIIGKDLKVASNFAFTLILIEALIISNLISFKD